MHKNKFGNFDFSENFLLFTLAVLGIFISCVISTINAWVLVYLWNFVFQEYIVLHLSLVQFFVLGCVLEFVKNPILSFKFNKEES